MVRLCNICPLCNLFQCTGLFVHNSNDIFQYAGDTRYAMLHLDRIKEDCRNMVTRNTTLWARDPLHSFPLPPQDIVDFLCLNDCSGHGQCSKGDFPLVAVHLTTSRMMMVANETVQVSVFARMAGLDPTALLTSWQGPGWPTSGTMACVM